MRCRVRLNAGTQEEIQLRSLVGIFTKVRSMCSLAVCWSTQILNWGGKENILVLGMADVQENLRQGVIGDPFLNTIQEQFAEYLKQCG